jgi:hypothetical protein
MHQFMAGFPENLMEKLRRESKETGKSMAHILREAVTARYAREGQEDRATLEERNLLHQLREEGYQILHPDDPRLRGGPRRFRVVEEATV